MIRVFGRIRYFSLVAFIDYRIFIIQSQVSHLFFNYPPKSNISLWMTHYTPSTRENWRFKFKRKTLPSETFNSCASHIHQLLLFIYVYFANYSKEKDKRNQDGSRFSQTFHIAGQLQPTQRLWFGQQHSIPEHEFHRIPTTSVRVCRAEVFREIGRQRCTDHCVVSYEFLCKSVLGKCGVRVQKIWRRCTTNERFATITIQHKYKSHAFHQWYSGNVDDIRWLHTNMVCTITLTPR